MFFVLAGGGAVKFADHAAAGLKDKIPLYGTGFLTDGTLEAQGEAANGIKTTLHYADNLDNPANKAFLDAFKKKTNPTATSMPSRATTRRRSSTSACGSRRRRRRARQDDRRDDGREDRPARGPISFSKAHNVVQNIYLREVRNGRNEYVSVAHANLADPARGCRMMA